MNLHPPKPLFSYFYTLPKQQQSSHEVVAYVVEVRRNRVDSPSEVEVMGEVEAVQLRVDSCNVKLKVKVSSQRDFVTDILDLFVELLSPLVILFVEQGVAVGVKHL